MKPAFPFIITTTIALLITSPSFSQEMGLQKKNTNGKMIIEQTVKAYGGEKTLNAIDKIYIDYKTTIISRGQSRGTTPPWDTIIADQKEAIDFSKDLVITEYTGQGGGSKVSIRTEIEGQSGHRLDLYSETSAPIYNTDFQSLAGQITRTNSTLLLKQAIKYKNDCKYLGEQLYNGKPHHLIQINPNNEPSITLYIDKSIKQISKSERSTDNFKIEYFFGKYQKQDGLLLPFQSSYSVNGDLARTMEVEAYTLNQPVRDLFSKHSTFTNILGDKVTPPATTVLDKGVYWVTQNLGGGLFGQSSLFIEFKDYVLMVGALSGARQRINHIKNKLGEKPIKYAIISHHHSDHIGGIQEIVEEGIPILVAKAHQGVISDSLSSKDKANIVVVGSDKSFYDESMRVDIINIGPTPHSIDFLLVHLPKLGIIFAADHFEIPSNGPLPPQSENSAFLAKLIQENNLNVTRIIPSHSARIASYEDLITVNNT
ncbi:MBL fold metallo-hydrolase [Microbulbifer epialgicus]|uniref:beta-lactamase n=1 Tax=Microbulbifer epialgicus TaxID=393907 RepID=A0ABV4P810_9GAMM